MDTPPAIVTNSHEEFLAACDRIHRREIRWLSIDVGKSNGQWIFNLLPPIAQKELFANGCTLGTKPPQKTAA